ncbi:kinesin-related protein 4-like [Phymastichus coffea]|uniref:kinesin-related protein 4-like n=1 Tax=Phymastichus coffea TaxID=108790 RepID=UPI00273C92B7|nr:kinesin-related protein 4-like [Phymastichus coffea]
MSRVRKFDECYCGCGNYDHFAKAYSNPGNKIFYKCNRIDHIACDCQSGKSQKNINKNNKEKQISPNVNNLDNNFKAHESFINGDTNTIDRYEDEDNNDSQDEDYEDEDNSDDSIDEDYEDEDNEDEFDDEDEDQDEKIDEHDEDNENDEVREDDTDDEAQIEQRPSYGNHSYDKTPPKSSAAFRKAQPIIPSSSDGGKYYYKDNYCCYCDKPFRRLNRHLLRMHGEKKTVKKIKGLPKNSSLRRSLFNLLTNIGNERFNNDEERNSEKRWIVKRRLAKNIGCKVEFLKNKKQKAKIDDQSIIGTEINHKNDNNKKKAITHSKDSNLLISKNYLNVKRRVICFACRGYYSKNTYARHFTTQHGDMKCEDTRTLLAAAQREMNLYHPNASDDLIRYVLPSLRDDVIGVACRFDHLIIRYGNRYVEQYDPIEQSELIRGHMRLIAKVLLAMKDLDGAIKDLQSSIHPNYFPIFLGAARVICKYDTERKTLGNAYNAHTIRVLWNRLHIILRGYYSENIANSELRRQAKTDLEDFFDLFKEQYLPVLGSKATKVQNDQRRQMSLKTNLITKADSATYIEFLTNGRDERLKLLQEKGFSLNIYNELMEFQMVLTMIFNGRRPGETERTRLWNFTHRLDVDKDDDYFQMLNPNEKLQASKYSVIIGQGKKIDGIDCTIYLTTEDVNALNVLTKLRKKAGINKQNRYLFAMKNGPDNVRMKYMKAYQSNKKLVKLCNKEYKKLRNPDIILATNVRKTIATDFANSNKSEDLALITSHLAHTDKVHKGTYRQSTVHRRVKITSILEERSKLQVNKALSNASDEYYKNNDINDNYYDNILVSRERAKISIHNEKPKNPSNPIKRKRILQLESSSEDEDIVNKDEMNRRPQSNKGMNNKIVNIDGLDNIEYQSRKTKENVNSRKYLNSIQNIKSTDMEGSSLSDETSSLQSESNLKSKSKKKTTSKGKRKYGFWTADQKQDFIKAFNKQLKNGKYASASDIRMAIKKFPSLKEKGEAAIRTRFSNIFKTNTEKIRKDICS